MQVRMVKVRAGTSFLYSVRCEDAAGVETEVCLFRTELEGKRFIKQLDAIAVQDDAGNIAKVAVATLMSIQVIAAKIASTGDQPSDDRYATKRHMREWAEEILGIAIGGVSLAMPAKTEPNLAAQGAAL